MCKEVYPQQPSFRKSKFAKLCVVCTIVCLIAMLTSFKGGHMLRGIVALLQTVLFASSWLMGMQILKEKKKFLHTLLAVIGLVLIVPFILCVNSDRLEKLDWPSSGLATRLPDPKVKYGEVLSNSDASLSIRLDKVKQSNYEKYVAACQKKGFTEESTDAVTSYFAYDSEGYALSVSYREYSSSMSIDLSAPIQMRELSWPKNGLAQLLPKPTSTYGRIDMDSSEQFAVYIGKTSLDSYRSYIEKVRDSGFNEDYNNSNDSYRAKNKDGYSVEVIYKGRDTMYIYLQKPYEGSSTSDASSTDTESPVETEPKEETKPEETDKDTTPTETDAADNTEVDPDLKAFLDEYEEFMDQYIDFMQKYENSSNTAAMLADYTAMMAKYVSFSNKAERYNSDTMSDADSAYYLEVMTRVNQKLTAAALE